MPNIDHPNLGRDIAHQGSWGNKSCAHKKITAEPNVADVLRFMILPKGTIITDFREVHGAAGGTNSAMSFGIAPVDGSAATVDAIMAAVVTETAGGNRMAKAPVVLTKDCYIIGVLSVADSTASVAFDVVVDYIYPGPG